MRKKNNTKMRCLDLFSGIGGFSLALDQVCTTVAYCEIDHACIDVLEDNMRVGNLDVAPVYRDIKQITSRDVKQLRPEIVVGGFPCQDISFSGHGAGLSGSRSSLFFEMMRLAGCCDSVKHVFLENSPFIRMRGLDVVISALRQNGFGYIVYGYLSASDVGAVHRRTRWVCIASKCPEEFPEMSLVKLRKKLDFAWTADAIPRIINRYPARSNHKNTLIYERCSTLGNSVVPQFISYVYHVFTQALLRPDLIRKNASSLTRDDGNRGVLFASIRRATPTPTPTSSTQTNREKEKDGGRWAVLPYIPLKENVLDLHLVGRTGKEFYNMSRWYTPVHSKTSWFFVLGKTSKGRWMCNTANNVYYERETRAVARKHIINPGFVEHLMGYPSGWTQAVENDDT